MNENFLSKRAFHSFAFANRRSAGKRVQEIASPAKFFLILIQIFIYAHFIIERGMEW